MSKLDWTLIAQYLTGACSKEEKDKFVNLVESDQEFKKSYFKAAQVWEESDSLLASNQYHKSEPEIDVQIEKMMGLIDKPMVQKREKIFPFKLSRIAASVIILLGIFSGIYFYTTPNNNREFSYIDKTTDRGEMERITLSDGTKVWLNVDSKLRYPNKFSGSNRQVELVGEAFFEVAKDSSKPFVVIAGQTITKVLGTSFNLNAYPNEENITLSVASGRVGFLTNSQSKSPKEDIYLLNPNQKIRYNVSTKKVETTSKNESEYDFAWKFRRLVFKNTKMYEVVKVLERWYNVEITVTDREILERTLTAEFSDKTVDHVLKMISPVVDAKYEKKGKRILLRRSHNQ
ncbi:MAG: FecR domain-containing protein [Flammeovirgaceae bacterium]|nr:FecR domain-containing protein [Flammeovirgaceae bacterium]